LTPLPLITKIKTPKKIPAGIFEIFKLFITSHLFSKEFYK